MAYNLNSPTSISTPCNLNDIESWVESELMYIEDTHIRFAVENICSNIHSFVRFAEEPILLWAGCDRVKPADARQRIHKYPDPLKQKMKSKGIKIDTRPNGPAIASFLLAGGKRPQRTGSTNGWSIHHIYSGKYPYFGCEKTTHSKNDGNHFTQSAGLVSAHPIADAAFDEFPFLTWLIRALAFKQFGYDPDSVFSSNTDMYGFTDGHTTKVCHNEG